MKTNEYFPVWLQELKRFQTLKSQIFLYGNIYDCYYFPVNYNEAKTKDKLKWAKFNHIEQMLVKYFKNEGYDLILNYDVIDKLTVEFNPQPVKEGVPESERKVITKENILQHVTSGNPQANEHFAGRNIQALENNLGDILSFFRFCVSMRETLCVSIINFASHFTANPNMLADEEARHFMKLVKAARESRVFPERGVKRNLLIFICDKLSDLPSWILLENPLTLGIDLQKPNRDERARFFSVQSPLFYQEGETVNQEEVGKLFPDLTDAFTNRELENLITLSQQEKLHINEMRKIIDLYKYGVKENFWEDLSAAKVNQAEEELKKRVFGQDPAIRKSVDIIRRAKLGLHTIDQKRPKNRPKGVLFFAGPTGVGKTELAKSLADLIFSTEDAIVRLDMSEYNDSNSDVKLIGSPPGYVGYEEGGQLTRKMHEKPFSIVLFDEVEKAHPIVFDKFLQILDDGRLTDGKGETVYFSEALIIFTSNLGIYSMDDNGRRVLNVRYEDSYDTIKESIMREIKNYFNFTLNRPEILNRFGDNFVVFDFIRPPVDRMILESNLKTIKANLLKQKKCQFEYDEEFIEQFLKYNVADNLVNGGRGILNRVETYIKNGLSQFLFQQEKIEGLRFKIFVDTKKKEKNQPPPVGFQLI
ncbi:MAG: AAA family ATPase [Spirochaetia bacterium]|nr:AAA family ATPase [Spirochaetia bacterium]